MKKNLGMTLLATTLLSQSAMAITKNVAMDMYGEQFKGKNIIPLKRLVREETHSSPRGWSVKKVVISAKSKKGMGEVSLKTSSDKTYPQVIPGTIEAFESLDTGFSTVNIHAPRSYRGQRNTRAQLILKGNIKVDTIKVKLNKQLKYDHTYDQGAIYEKVAEFKAHKVIGNGRTIKINGYLDAIKLKATKGKVNVSEVKVVFKDGEKVLLDEIDGKLKAGRGSKVFVFKGFMNKHVRKIIVSATSTNIFGSRGKVAVMIAK